jgi:hypothetical protein
MKEKGKGNKERIREKKNNGILEEMKEEKK